MSGNWHEQGNVLQSNTGISDMKKNVTLGLLLSTFTFAAVAAPTYEQAKTFRNAMNTLMSRSFQKLDNPAEYRVHSREMQKLEPMAIKLFGAREKAANFDVCIDAASLAWNYWQTQMSTAMKPSNFGIGSTARAGFDFGVRYGECSAQIELLDSPTK